MDPLAIVRKKDSPASLAASGRFGNFRPEIEQAVRAFDVGPSPIMDAMAAAWKRCHYRWELLIKGVKEKKDLRSGVCEEAIGDLECSANDVERFSIKIAEFQNEKDFREKAGYFLSTLINMGKDRDFIIHTKHLGDGIDSLGVHNTKNIYIKGDGGTKCGCDMRSGTIIVEGNVAYNGFFYMHGGSAIVRGDAGGSCGHYMTGGDVLVRGDCAYHCGEEMSRGKITVEGDAGFNCGKLMGGGIVHVKGSVETRCGLQMKRGYIIIDGDAGECCGSEKEGGRIHVCGNAGDACGYSMRGGIIEVDGNAGDRCGESMLRGKIHIKGEIASISGGLYGGRVYQKRRLVWPKEGRKG